MARRGKLRRRRLATYYDQLKSRGEQLAAWQLDVNMALAHNPPAISEPNKRYGFSVDPETMKQAEKFWSSSVTHIQGFAVKIKEQS